MSSDKPNFRELAEKLVEKVLKESAQLDAIEVAEELLEQYYPAIPTVETLKSEKVWISYREGAFEWELSEISDNPEYFLNKFRQWSDENANMTVEDMMDHNWQSEWEVKIEEGVVSRTKVNG